MAVGKTMRLNKVLRELNISLDRAVEYLAKNGHEIVAEAEDGFPASNSLVASILLIVKTKE